MPQMPESTPEAATILTLLEPLAALAEEHHHDTNRLIEGMLALLAGSLNVGLTFLSRVEGPSLHIIHVHDRAGMGLYAGDVVPLCDSY